MKRGYCEYKTVTILTNIHFLQEIRSLVRLFDFLFFFFSSFSFAFSVLRFATPQCRLLIVWLHLLFEFAVSQTEQSTR